MRSWCSNESTQPVPKHRQEVLPRGPDNGAISLDSGMMGCSLPGWLGDGYCVPWVLRWWINVHSPVLRR